MVQVLEHAPLSNDVANTLGAYHFIFPDVLERKSEARVFPLDDAHLAECALANNSQQSEVVEVYCWGVSDGVRYPLLARSRL